MGLGSDGGSMEVVMRRKRKSSGFTLVEILIALSLLGASKARPVDLHARGP